ncbi:MAG: hypothetical protein KatS3mg115_1255 [Candidatus Poribacteria bacterium]|nr:MAG: hypothetical protein KatS3mg115_1255 [Candidatus Poribacteria bacterium]
MSHLRRVRTGLDRLIEEDFATLSGSNVALVTNGTALSAHLTDTVAAFVAASGLRLRAIFAPEHGFLGATQAGEVVWDGTERRTGVPIYSLYGRRLEPTPEMLDGVDVIVYDMQDVGARYYTYLATLRNVLHTASRLGRRVVICDRPNPLGGAVVEGFPPYEKEFSALVSPAPMPIRYGLTVGEYARWLVNHLGWEVELEVVPLSGWRRDLSYEETGLIWAPPSPNVPTISSVWAYAGTCLIEGTNLSEGRGTTLPFEQFGAPWVDGFRLADQLNALELPGVFFRPVAFTPTFSKHAGLRCEGGAPPRAGSESVPSGGHRSCPLDPPPGVGRVPVGAARRFVFHRSAAGNRSGAKTDRRGSLGGGGSRRLGGARSGLPAGGAGVLAL